MSLFSEVVLVENDRNLINNFSSSAYAGVMNSLIGLDISKFPDFSSKNHEIMRYHMLRNDIQKSLMRDGMGESAYPNGNSENDSVPVGEYTYTINHSYIPFYRKISTLEKMGINTTRLTTLDGHEANYYIDYESDEAEGESRSAPIEFSNDIIDADSILYKTKRLFNMNKINTIISKFHTDGVKYPGQVRTQYGESHGRNLLTKSAENGEGGYDINGYDNPYCRVWTHHYMYDNLSKTMRANSENINYWGEQFEWHDDDKGHITDNTRSYNDEKGKDYDYAWRGRHNQERRLKNSVLDAKTGLVNMTPKYLGGGEKNIHTKSCMFSIENLAWKDYDPYSFEKALSWEQRGPNGGRIMWFPPYDLTFNETNIAAWNKNTFIGRGEPIYTYTNSERNGILSFLMIVDHPSSIDYSSWHDGYIHDDNDYHRYFAGCFGDVPDDSIDSNSTNKMAGESVNGVGLLSEEGSRDNIVEYPPYMVDEYEQQVPNLIQAKEELPEVKAPKVVEPSTPIEVEFFVFFPNNYSGCYDLPYDKTHNSEVDVISYLIGGIGAQKEDGYKDIPLNLQMVFGEDAIGYEMGDGGISNNSDTNNIIGSYTTNRYSADNNRKWEYRIDCYRDGDKKYGIKNGDWKTKNTITQKISKKNYKDSKSFHLNRDITNILEAGITTNNEIYTFVDVVRAMSDEKILNYPNVRNYIDGKHFCDGNKVSKLIDIFSNYSLTKIEYSGGSNEQGENSSKSVNQSRNRNLAESRGKTILMWLQQYDKFKGVEGEGTVNDGMKLSAVDKNDDNTLMAKAYRNAHFKLEFTSVKQYSETQSDNEVNKGDDAPNKIVGNFNYKNYVGFKYLRTETHIDDNGKEVEWNYYLKEPGKIYFEEQNNITSDTLSKNNNNSGINNEIVIPKEWILGALDSSLFQGSNTEGAISRLDSFKGDYDPNLSYNIGDIVYTYSSQGDKYMLQTNNGLKDLKYFDMWDKTIQEKIANILELDFDAFKEEYIQSIDRDVVCIYSPRNKNSYGIKWWEYGDMGDYLKKGYIEDGIPSNPNNPTNVSLLTKMDEIYNHGVFNEEKAFMNEVFPDGDEEKIEKSIIIYRLLSSITGYTVDGNTVDIDEVEERTNVLMKEKKMYEENPTAYEEDCNNIWVDRGEGILIKECDLNGTNDKLKYGVERSRELNKLRYDQEYLFFRKYLDDHPIIYQRLKDKIKYFNPAFHSMSPEGFNSRLTFLNQCTRQGQTLTRSNPNIPMTTANNLAFGRPPYCVLRIGDFYNQMIVIENINYDFSVSNGIVWDLNTEGNGVQPMLCRVAISFSFIGGGDITGPVQRLQNALSFNYYANTSFYDNRADRIEYDDVNYSTMGGAGNNKINLNKSYTHSVQNYDDSQYNLTKL